MMKTEMPQDSSSFGKTRPMPSSIGRGTNEMKDQPMSSVTKGKGANSSRPGMLD